MAILFVALAFAPPSLDRAIRDAIAAHQRTKTFRVELEVQTRNPANRTRNRYELNVRGSDFSVRMRDDQNALRAASDRRFLFRADTAEAYDAIANERLSRPLPPMPRMSQIVTVLGPMDDALRFHLSPPDLADFLQTMRSLGRWQWKSGAFVRDVVAPGGRNRASLRFDPRTRRIVEVVLNAPGTYAKWTARALPDAPLTLGAPKNAKRVVSFTVKAAPPKYADAASRQLAERMIAAVRRLDRTAITIQDGAASLRIFRSRGKLRQDGPNGSVVFDGKVVSLLSRPMRTLYRGKGVAADAVIRGSVVGLTADPMFRQWAYGQVPFAEFLQPEMRVTGGGQLTMDGVAYQALNFVSPNLRVSALIQANTGLPVGVSSTTLDGRGRTLATGGRRFRYRRMTAAEIASGFSLRAPAGFGTRPLPLRRR